MYRSAIPAQWIIKHMMNHDNRNHGGGTGGGPKFGFPTTAYYNYAGCVEMVPLISLDAATSSRSLMSKPPPLSSNVPRRSPPIGVSLEIHSLEKPARHWNGGNDSDGSCGGSGGSSSGGQRRYNSSEARDPHQQKHAIIVNNNNIYNDKKDKIFLNSQGPRLIRSSSMSSIISVSSESSNIQQDPLENDSLTPSSVTSLINKGIKRRLDVSPVAIIKNHVKPADTSSSSPSLTDEPEIIYIGTKRKPQCEIYEVPVTTIRTGKPPGCGGGGTDSANCASNQRFNGGPRIAFTPNRNGFTFPSQLLDGSIYDTLSVHIWNKFMSCKQSNEMFDKKMRLHGVLTRIMKESYPSCGLYIVGSSMTTFGTNKSDMDACLMLTVSDIDQRTDALNILQGVLQVIRKFDFFVKAELIRAKVPIVEFQDTVSGVEVDLNINNAVGIRNTYLLRAYANLDWRVSPLVLIVKIWARAHDINDAKNMTISSYSLALMVIHYLQYPVQPPVLPCLQKLYPHNFSPELDVRTLSLEEKFQVPMSQNSQSLGELLLGFFNYYANDFDYQEDAISVRLGRKVPKHFVKYQNARKNCPGMWNCLCIEEPFDMTNTARSVYDEEVFRKIKNVFKTSYTKLERTKDLQSIM